MLLESRKTAFYGGEVSSLVRASEPSLPHPPLQGYAQRLGLWGGSDFPFDKRTDLVAAIEVGGVAAMEVLARVLRALGLYSARSLSYEGVEYELLEHQLMPDQVRIYDAYAGAFQVIHNSLDAALQASNVTSSEGGIIDSAMPL